MGNTQKPVFHQRSGWVKKSHGGNMLGTKRLLEELPTSLLNFILRRELSWVIAHPVSHFHPLLRYESFLPSSEALTDPAWRWKLARGWEGRGEGEPACFKALLEGFPVLLFPGFPGGRCFSLPLGGPVFLSLFLLLVEWIFDPPIYSFPFYPPSYLVFGGRKTMLFASSSSHWAEAWVCDSVWGECSLVRDHAKQISWDIILSQVNVLKASLVLRKHE